MMGQQFHTLNKNKILNNNNNNNTQQQQQQNNFDTNNFVDRDIINNNKDYYYDSIISQKKSNQQTNNNSSNLLDILDNSNNSGNKNKYKKLENIDNIEVIDNNNLNNKKSNTSSIINLTDINLTNNNNNNNNNSNNSNNNKKTILKPLELNFNPSEIEKNTESALKGFLPFTPKSQQQKFEENNKIISSGSANSTPSPSSTSPSHSSTSPITPQTSLLNPTSTTSSISNNTSSSSLNNNNSNNTTTITNSNKSNNPAEKYIIPMSTTRVCEFCGSSSTPTWRRGPSGKGSLCNACGIKWRLKGKDGVFKPSQKQQSRQKPSTSQPKQPKQPNPQPQQSSQPSLILNQQTINQHLQMLNKQHQQQASQSMFQQLQQQIQTNQPQQSQQYPPSQQGDLHETHGNQQFGYSSTSSSPSQQQTTLYNQQQPQQSTDDNSSVPNQSPDSYKPGSKKRKPEFIHTDLSGNPIEFEKGYYCKYCKKTWPQSSFRNSQQFGAHCSNCSRKPKGELEELMTLKKKLSKKKSKDGNNYFYEEDGAVVPYWDTNRHSNIGNASNTLPNISNFTTQQNQQQPSYQQQTPQLPQMQSNINRPFSKIDKNIQNAPLLQRLIHVVENQLLEPNELNSIREDIDTMKNDLLIRKKRRISQLNDIKQKSTQDFQNLKGNIERGIKSRDNDNRTFINDLRNEIDRKLSQYECIYSDSTHTVPASSQSSSSYNNNNNSYHSSSSSNYINIVNNNNNNNNNSNNNQTSSTNYNKNVIPLSPELIHFPQNKKGFYRDEQGKFTIDNSDSISLSPISRDSNTDNNLLTS